MEDYTSLFHQFKYRLLSFEKMGKWKGVQTPYSLASNGFYYTGISDEVRCFFCGLIVHKWQDEDTAHGEHGKWNPKCLYFNLFNENDVDEDMIVTSLRQEENFKLFEERLLSFKRWNGTHTPKELALKGFFIEQDIIRCAFCGIYGEEDDVFHSSCLAQESETPQPQKENFKLFEDRLLSFKRWNGDHTPKELALKGFFKEENIIRCVFCGISGEEDQVFHPKCKLQELAAMLNPSYKYLG